jgi:transposase
MANLKLDLLNKIRNDKYYKELELVRLAQDSNVEYLKKINTIQLLLQSIAMLNSEIELIEQYFKQPVQQPVQQPQGHQGQSHRE